MTDQSDLYFGGMPVEPDLDRLDEAYPEIKVGDYLPYDEIGVAIQAPYGSHRWKTVTSAWRSRLLVERRLVLRCDPGKGFVCMSDQEKIDAAPGVVTAIARKARRERVKVSTVQDARLTVHRDHVTRLMNAVEVQALSARKAMLIPVADVLPRRLPEVS